MVLRNPSPRRAVSLAVLDVCLPEETPECSRDPGRTAARGPTTAPVRTSCQGRALPGRAPERSERRRRRPHPGGARARAWRGEVLHDLGGPETCVPRSPRSPLFIACLLVTCHADVRAAPPGSPPRHDCRSHPMRAVRLLGLAAAASYQLWLAGVRTQAGNPQCHAWGPARRLQGLLTGLLAAEAQALNKPARRGCSRTSKGLRRGT
jgi:hypothetical protein